MQLTTRQIQFNLHYTYILTHQIFIIQKLSRTTKNLAPSGLAPFYAPKTHQRMSRINFLLPGAFRPPWCGAWLSCGRATESQFPEANNKDN